MKKKNEYIRRIRKYNEGALYPTSYEDAVIGIVQVDAERRLLVSIARLVGIMRVRDGMSEEEAMEYFEYNIRCAHMGEDSPVYLEDL